MARETENAATARNDSILNQDAQGISTGTAHNAIHVNCWTCGDCLTWTSDWGDTKIKRSTAQANATDTDPSCSEEATGYDGWWS